MDEEAAIPFVVADHPLSTALRNDAGFDDESDEEEEEAQAFVFGVVEGCTHPLAACLRSGGSNSALECRTCCCTFFLSRSCLSVSRGVKREGGPSIVVIRVLSFRAWSGSEVLTTSLS